MLLDRLGRLACNRLMADEFFESSDSARNVGPLTHATTFQLPGPLDLELGDRIDEVQVAYETYGQLSERKDNAILICHALSGDSHVCRHDDDDEAGWWDIMIGPGKCIDTDKYFVICPSRQVTPILCMSERVGNTAQVRPAASGERLAGLIIRSVSFMSGMISLLRKTWSPNVTTSTPYALSFLKSGGVIPLPPAMFSALQMTKSMLRWVMRSFRWCARTSRPGRPTTSPMHKIFTDMRSRFLPKR